MDACNRSGKERGTCRSQGLAGPLLKPVGDSAISTKISGQPPRKTPTSAVHTCVSPHKHTQARITHRYS